MVMVMVMVMVMGWESAAMGMEVGTRARLMQEASRLRMTAGTSMLRCVRRDRDNCDKGNDQSDLRHEIVV